MGLAQLLKLAEVGHLSLTCCQFLPLRLVGVYRDPDRDLLLQLILSDPLYIRICAMLLFRPIHNELPLVRDALYWQVVTRIIRASRTIDLHLFILKDVHLAIKFITLHLNNFWFRGEKAL